MNHDEIRERLKDPVFHIEKAQGVTLEEYQRAICRAVARYDRNVVTACHDVGKTFTAARIVIWFCSTKKNSKTITTAPTYRQVELLLWSEIRNGFHRSRIELGGRMLTTRWNVSDEWFAVGIASGREKGSESHGSSFQGVHGRHVLLVLDEAQGVHQDIWKQSEGIMTSAGAKMVAIGNPLTRGGPFYEATKDPLWNHLKLTCFDSPNLLANGISDVKSLKAAVDGIRGLRKDDLINSLNTYKIIAPHLLTVQWVLPYILKYGLDHPLVQAKILGQFPDTDENNLIPLVLLETSKSKGLSEKPPRYLGVDVARMGSDATAIVAANDEGLCWYKSIRKKTNTEVGGLVTKILTENPIIACAIDATGLGSGVLDIVNENNVRNNVGNVKILECHFGATATTRDAKEKYVNLKTQMYCELKDAMNEGFGLDDSEVWEEQLGDVRFKIDKYGRIEIESKDAYKSRTGKSSPDEGDGLVLAVHAKNHYNTVADISYDELGLDLTKTSNWKA